MDPKLALSWDAYQKSICNGFSLLQQRGEFVDMTLAADGHHVKVHQMVLSLVSPFIKDLITSANCPHPVIFLNKVSYQTLQGILEYAYTGEVLVARESLYEFLDACKALHIKGLEDQFKKSSADEVLVQRMMGDVAVDENVSTDSPERAGQPVIARAGVKRKRVNTADRLEPCDYDSLEESNIGDDALDDHEKDLNQDDEEKYKKAKQIQDLAGSVVQYSLSCHGSIQVVLNRFLYRLRHPRKNNEKMYRCAEYNKKACPAYVVTKGDMVLERGCAHNHTFHDKQILKRVQNGNMYTQYKAAKTVALLNKNTAPKTNEDDSEED